jgi:type IX secretion system PorP/SprF family membrane protein
MKNILKIIVSLVMVNSFAQELTIPTYTQYLGDNPYVISPAYAGIGDNIKIRVNGLTQWVGLKNAPDNQSLAVDGRLGQRSGLGAFLYNDRNGNTFQKGGKVSFAHHLILDYYDNQYLSFGMSFVMNQFYIDITQFDPSYDPITTNNRDLNNYNVDLGLLYRKQNFFFAANVTNLLKKNTDKFIIKEPNILRNFSAYTGYIVKGNNSDVEIEPSIFYQYFQNDRRSSTDVNVKVRFMDYENYYWAGISYRFLNDQLFTPLNIGPMVGLKKNNFYFAYSYQITTNALSTFNSGTHMVTLGYDIFQGLSNCPCTSNKVD